MAFTWDLIRKNLETYNKAKEEIEMISEYERGEATLIQMSQVGLIRFADFWSFLQSCQKAGFDPIDPQMTWRKLKPLLIEKTQNVRFKKFLSNRTQTQFISLLTTNPEDYDRLLNGRWLKKPRTNRKGTLLSGKRSDDKAEGLKECFVPIMNYVINWGIETSKDNNDVYKGFEFQSLNLQMGINWYIKDELKLDEVPFKEISVSRNLLSSFVETIQKSEIDFRKLNLDFITNSISEKIKKNMKITEGTMLKAIRDIEVHGQKRITKDVTYRALDSHISGGIVRVYLQDDTGYKYYFFYRDFEDITFHRNDLLRQLLGE
jgi:hypothetical protein